MPLYEYECPKGHTFDRYMSAKDHKRKQKCECGKMATQIITKAPMGFVQPDVCYDSPIDGRPITSRAARRDDLARNHCQEYDPEMKRDAERFRKETQDKLEREIDETVERQIAGMDGRKLERLGTELTSGADINVERI